MMNNVWLVGRLVKDIEVHETESNKKVANITLAITRNFKNDEGVYETDFIDVTLFNVIAQRSAEYCKKGDLIAVKGSIQKFDYEKNGDKKTTQKIVANNVSFLTTKSKDSIEQER